TAADTEPARCTAVIVRLGYAWLQEREVEDVASVERQIDDRSACYRLAQGRADGFHSHGVAGYLDSFRRAPNLHLDIEPKVLVDLKLLFLGHQFLETSSLSGDSVSSDGEVQDAESPIRACL